MHFSVGTSKLSDLASFRISFFVFVVLERGNILMKQMVNWWKMLFLSIRQKNSQKKTAHDHLHIHRNDM